MLKLFLANFIFDVAPIVSNNQNKACLLIKITNIKSLD